MAKWSNRRWAHGFAAPHVAVDWASGLARLGGHGSDGLGCNRRSRQLRRRLDLMQLTTLRSRAALATHAPREIRRERYEISNACAEANLIFPFQTSGVCTTATTQATSVEHFLDDCFFILPISTHRKVSRTVLHGREHVAGNI